MGVTRRHIVTAVTAAASLAACAVPASAATIANSGPATTLPSYSGSTWPPTPITSGAAPQNPFMAANGKSNLHNDTWMTDAYATGGPLGKSPVVSSNDFGVPAPGLPGLCASITFDSRGRLITICIKREAAAGASGTVPVPKLRLLDPTTLAVLDEYSLPADLHPSSGNIFQNFTGGGYFYLDNFNRVVVATNDRKIAVIPEKIDGSGFDTTAITHYDIASALASDEKISSALPDWQGRIWFVSKKNGKVGFVKPPSVSPITTNPTVAVTTLGEEIENSFAVGSDGVYIVSDKALYRFNAISGAVHKDWRTVYSNSGIRKPSQVDAGSGTTPTIMTGGLVAITDNADPMNVVVYKTTTGAKTCSIPVFSKGASATENSLVGAGGMLIVENNYGYESPNSVSAGRMTQPGFVRVNVSSDGKSCTKAWANTEERAPSVVAKLSLANGLLYTFTKPATSAGDTSTPWFWTAINARTGARVWRKLAGRGYFTFNNNYAGIHLGPDGAAYLGALGGLLRIKDTP